jgi:YggT family protein
MLTQAIVFLITTLGDLFAAALLLRFVLQWLRVPAGNPLSPLLAAVTDFAVRPVRRIVPGLWGLDLATLLLAWLSEALQLWLLLKLGSHAFGPDIGIALIGIAGIGAVRLLQLAITLAIIALIAQALLSWVNPTSPLAPLLDTLTRPILRPLRRKIPPVGNVDLTPLIALIVCQLLLIVPLPSLEGFISHLL